MATNFHWFCSNRSSCNHWRWMFNQSKGRGSSEIKSYNRASQSRLYALPSLIKTDALAPFTVLSESRDHLHYDSFGHLLGVVINFNCVIPSYTIHKGIISLFVSNFGRRWISIRLWNHRKGKNETLTHMFELTCIADACLFPSLGCKKIIKTIGFQIHAWSPYRTDSAWNKVVPIFQMGIVLSMINAPLDMIPLKLVLTN